ncbi:MAG: anti-sigma factor, partial [Acidimicrobiia bacterium]
FDAPPPDLWATIEADVAAESGSTAPVIALAPRRRVAPLLLVAACVALVAGLSAVAFGRSGAKTRVLASAALSSEGLSPAAKDSHGSVRLEQRDGRNFLLITVEDAPPTDGAYLEVWMIDRKVEGMVSLGPWHGNGRYDIPAGVDPERFPVVDVSIEPLDGKPVHSGESAVRGVLA